MPDTSEHELLDLAYPYALDAVGDSERDEIEQRVATAGPETSRAFTVVVRGVRETMGALSVLDAKEPAPELEARILAALDRARPADPSAAAPLTRPSRRPRLRWLAAAAAVVVAAGVGGGIVAQQHAGRTANPPMAEQIMRQPDAHTASAPLSTGGMLTVHASTGMGAATVAFDSVPPAPQGHVYQLWVVPPTGAPRSAGVMDSMPSSSAPMVATYSGGDALAVTVEPAGGSPAPTTTPIGTMPMS
ncbi:anti-sigma factor [Nocardia aobensis]|uniref:anti-sigma factor n=1 Tax=Nocardia aobensis TaxID=257277 RepID=UPI0002E71F1E|nr:anti-sigma factor [Nocardia aobensis]